MYRSQLHDSPIRCLALDPHEEFFVTGAADGDIKVIIHSKFLNIFIGELLTCRLGQM